MSDPTSPDDDKTPDASKATGGEPVTGGELSTGDGAATGDGQKKRPAITTNRIVLWVVVTGIALYLLISGIVGIITKSH
jgi:hypothetical protein